MQINKKNLSVQVYEVLKQDILAQRIGFGALLVNRELQERFSVSSTPVRDAIHRLYQDGLLEDITQGGAHVVKFNVRSALEVNEIVGLLNRDAMALTVRKGTQAAVIAGLEEIIGQQASNLQEDSYIELDKKFHHTLFEHCGNRRLLRVYHEHDVLWDLHIRYYHKNQEDSRPHALRQHQEILESYRRGEYERALDLVESHFLNAVSNLERMLAEEE